MANAKYVVAVPEGISSIDAGPLSCAGVTTYKALKVAKIVPVENVAIFGISGLGHLAAQYARIMGGTGGYRFEVSAAEVLRVWPSPFSEVPPTFSTSGKRGRNA